MRKTERKEEINQSSRLHNADRENILYQKLVKKIFEIAHIGPKNEKRKDVLEIKVVSKICMKIFIMNLEKCIRKMKKFQNILMI